jgi:hypothetical protein
MLSSLGLSLVMNMAYYEYMTHDASNQLRSVRLRVSLFHFFTLLHLNVLSGNIILDPSLKIFNNRIYP